MRAVGNLVAVSLVVAALTVGPVGLLFGPDHWICGAVGFGLSLPPAVGTLWLTGWLAGRSPFGGLMGMALGPVLRILVVLVAAGGVFGLARYGEIEAPALGHPLKFWLWVLFAYLVTLVAETVLLAAAAPPRRPGATGG